MEHNKRDKIKWRSDELFRVECWCDAVLACAGTLLLISLEVPKSFNELLHNMNDILAFFIGWLFLFQIWHTQYTYFRRFGLIDNHSLLLNALLMFGTFSFMYPLRFLFTYLTYKLGHIGNVESLVSITDAQIPMMMTIFGLSFSFVFLLFTLMYKHALALKEELNLDAEELYETKTHLTKYLMYTLTGILSVLVAIGFPKAGVIFSGGLYLVVIPIVFLYYLYRNKQKCLNYGFCNVPHLASAEPQHSKNS